MESTAGSGGRFVASRSFNGATASLPWNPALFLKQDPSVVALQWGHGISAVESEGLLVARNN